MRKFMKRYGCKDSAKESRKEPSVPMNSTNSGFYNLSLFRIFLYLDLIQKNISCAKGNYSIKLFKMSVFFLRLTYNDD